MSTKFNNAVGFKLNLSKSPKAYQYNYDQLWFNYNNKLLGALIFRGRKLHAYKMLLQLRHALKLKEGMDPSLVF